jgi:hypothetical protein
MSFCPRMRPGAERDGSVNRAEKMQSKRIICNGIGDRPLGAAGGCSIKE